MIAGGFDDGLYAAVRLLEILSDLRLSLDEVLDELQGSVYTRNTGFQSVRRKNLNL